MNIYKAQKRDRKIEKRKNGMVVDGKGIFILEEQKKKKAEALKKKRDIQRKENERWSSLNIEE